MRTWKAIAGSLVVAAAVTAACVTTPPPMEGGEEALRKPPQDRAGLVSKLGAALEASDPVVRMRAANALLDLGPAAQPAVDQLIKAAQTSDQGTKVMAITALGAAGGQRAGEFLAKLVSGENDPTERASAARALAVMKASDRIPALQEAMRSRDRLVRAQAMEAIATIGGDQARESASAMIGSDDPLIRVHAASLLAATEPRGREILMEAASSSDPTLRTAALAAIVQRVATGQLQAEGVLRSVPADLTREEQIAVQFIQAVQGQPGAADALAEMSMGEGQGSMQAAMALGSLIATRSGGAAREQFISRTVEGSGALSMTQVSIAVAALNIPILLAAPTAGGGAEPYEPLVPRLEATLKTSTDVGARTLAARALGFIGTEAARAALKSALEAERDLGVRLTIETGMFR